MAGTIVSDVLQNGAGANTSMDNAIYGSAKAWVNFVGSSGSIRASYNVSSVTRTATGTYTINFTNAMTDANYSFVTGSSPTGAGNDGTVLLSNPSNVPTSSALYLLNGKPGSLSGGFTGSLADCPYNCVTIFR